MTAIGKEDFEEVFGHLTLGITIINTYIMFLYDKLIRPRGLESRFAFINPNVVHVGSIISKPYEVIAFVLSLFMASKDTEKLFFLPYNTGPNGHWLLVAINPVREIIYYLDSLGNDWTTYPDMKKTIDTILQSFRAQRDIQVPRSRVNNISWIKMECPRQRNGVDCGYFMLRFMKETILLDRLEIPSTI
ncbi:unnamed protein product [Vicia faba]|uniref:Ubiquitin-like protease family profile domain-containing protein n=1 Tax=Vicia faba TaxID=3906 RepID=A0AAV1AHS5_VICFA|nr:unnamed protein product [Vicia faba]